jgi:ribosomal protein S18 acetylase RimI-like enzyme
VTVRRAVVEDAEALADVHITTWQKAYAGILPETYLNTMDRSRRSGWWRRFLDQGAEVHVADAGGVVGFCHADSSADEGWGEIYSIYVHPDSWGAGYGRALLVAAESTLVALGFERALLWVLEDNARARGFYESQGWAPGRPFRVEEIGGRQVTEVRYEKLLTAGPRPVADPRER